MKIIHAARLGDGSLIKLKEIEPGLYGWFNQETALNIEAKSIEEAFRLARKAFKFNGFEPINCGYKFTLPERDEHGKEALYIDMVRSLASPNGIFFDETLGHNVVVHQIPLISRDLKL